MADLDKIVPELFAKWTPSVIAFIELDPEKRARLNEILAKEERLLRPFLLSLTKPERGVISRSLQDRRSRLIEKIGDTSEDCRARDAAQQELNFIMSVIAKMRAR